MEQLSTLKTEDGFTPLRVAEKMGYTAIVELLRNDHKCSICQERIDANYKQLPYHHLLH